MAGESTSTPASLVAASKRYGLVLSTCTVTYFDPKLEGGQVSPLVKLESYFEHTPEYAAKTFTLDPNVKVKVLQGFKHGSLQPHPQFPGDFILTRRDPNYFGNDQAVFEIEHRGQLIKLIYRTQFKWNDQTPEEHRQCPGKVKWIGSGDATDGRITADKRQKGPGSD